MNILGSLASALGGGQSPLSAASLLPALIEQIKKYPGGLTGLIDSFRKGGLGEIVTSWIGSGQNLPVSADQLRAVLPDSMIGALSQASGQDNGSVLSLLTSLLPQVVDKATPAGQPDEQALNSGGLLGALSGLLK
ncbi:DUF937 domain-containing protein [Alcaligenaceae bacterium SJ-26]|nr:DUF937 domain-containing protein [Alcaligenaceae bacterium SJ-26]